MAATALAPIVTTEDQDLQADWLDITQLLQEAAKEMSPGQLIHNDKFTLYEAMSCIEMMDAKMDGGRNADKSFTLEEALDQGNLPPTSSLPLPVLLFVIDKLLIAETMWLDGYTLLQTVFSCLYLHDMTVIDNPILKAFAVSLLKRCSIERDALMRASIYEEEDFAAQLFGHTLVPDVDVDTALKDIDKQIEDLQQKASGESDAKQKDLLSAIMYRLQLSRELLQAQFYFDKENCQGLDDAKAALSKCTAILKNIERTKDLSEAIPEGQVIFDPENYRRFVSSVPPRPVVWPTFTDTVKTLTRMVEFLTEVCSITQYSTLKELKEFFINFTERDADLLSRARLMTCAFKDMKLFGQHLLVDLLYNEAGLYDIPKSYFNNIARPTVVLLSKYIIKCFRILCNNKARLRRKLAHVAEDLSMLITDAEYVDEKNLPASAKNNREDAPHYLTLWCMDYTIDAMVHHLQLGFQLDMYEEYEFPAIFWYMDGLLSQRHFNQQHVLKYNEIQRQKLKALRSKRGVRGRPQIDPPTQIPQTTFSKEIEIRYLVNKGIMQFLGLLWREKKLSTGPPNLHLGSPEMRFYRRFQPFQHIGQPGLFPYGRFELQFLRETEKTKPEAIALVCMESLSAAQSLISDFLKNYKPSAILANEMKQILRVVITNSMNIRTILSASKLKDPNTRTTFDFSVHHWYPIIDVK